jgi:phosphotransferase system IIA component
VIDLSNLKAPGWQRIVAELSAPAPDDSAFIMRLVSVLGQVAGARQAVFFTVTGQREDDQSTAEARPELVWPGMGGEGTVSRAMSDSNQQAPIEHLTDVKAAAIAAAQARQTRVFGLDESSTTFYGEGNTGKGHLVALPISGGVGGDSAAAPLRGVVTLFLDNRSRQALQTTLALLEVLAGYVFSHAAMQSLKRTKQAGASLDLAGRLLASLNATSGFKGCGFQLVNDLARQLGVDRVALAWVAGPGAHDTNPASRRFCKMVAISDTENIDRRMAMVQKLEAAMDECLDQQQTVMFPPPPASGTEAADAVLSRAITQAHRELASGDVRLKVASFPLRISDKAGERVVGVVSLETTGDGSLELSTIELVQATLDLIAPVLLVRRSDDRNLALRAKDSALRSAAWLVGPTHTAWKLLGATLLAASLVVTFVRVPYRVGAPMEIRPREMRTVSAPFEGVLWSIAPGIESGAKVESGQTLAEFDTVKLRLETTEISSEILRFEKEVDEAMKSADVGKAQQAQAQADQARAKLARLQFEISRATLTAPISGTIISSDIKDKIRAQVKIGDPLFQIANLNDLVAVVRVEDRDIALVKVEQMGEVSPKSAPDVSVPVIVEQIVPLAAAHDGVNAFEVRARLVPKDPAQIATFRPGVEGQARLEGPEMSLIGIASRRIVDQARLWLWW